LLKIYIKDFKGFKRKRKSNETRENDAATSKRQRIKRIIVKTKGFSARLEWEIIHIRF
jgi:hypothetical protein